MSEDVKINPEILHDAREIFMVLAQQRPEHSLSFVLSAEGSEAINDTFKIVEWGIGGNKSKIKATALELLDMISEVPSGTPVNVNLTEYELKAMWEVVAAIDKAEENHINGLLT